MRFENPARGKMVIQGKMSFRWLFYFRRSLSVLSIVARAFRRMPSGLQENLRWR